MPFMEDPGNSPVNRPAETEETPVVETGAENTQEEQDERALAREKRLKKKQRGNIAAFIVAIVIILAVLYLVLGAAGIIPTPIDWSRLGFGPSTSQSKPLGSGSSQPGSSSSSSSSSSSTPSGGGTGGTAGTTGGQGGGWTAPTPSQNNANYARQAELSAQMQSDAARLNEIAGLINAKRADVTGRAGPLEAEAANLAAQQNALVARVNELNVHITNNPTDQNAINERAAAAQQAEDLRVTVEQKNAQIQAIYAEYDQYTASLGGERSQLEARFNAALAEYNSLS